MEHKMKQDSLERSQSDLKKLRRKSQGKNANKYENKESEVRLTYTYRRVTHHTWMPRTHIHSQTLTPEMHRVSASVTGVGDNV